MVYRKILLISIGILSVLAIGFALGINFNKFQLHQSTSALRQQAPAPSVVKSKDTCSTQEECHILYATQVASAVASIRVYTKNQKLDISPKGDTISKSITTYCTEDGKDCWDYDNKNKKVLGKK